MTEDCGICLELLRKNYEFLPCKHKFHKKCLKNLSKSNCQSKLLCPICRYSIIKVDEDPEGIISIIIEIIIEGIISIIISDFLLVLMMYMFRYPLLQLSFNYFDYYYSIK
jgi:hypothetical protein